MVVKNLYLEIPQSKTQKGGSKRLLDLVVSTHPFAETKDPRSTGRRGYPGGAQESEDESVDS